MNDSSAPGPRCIVPTDLGVWEVFERSMRHHADRVAIRWRDEVWTYADLHDAVADRADQLRARGAIAGSRIMLVHANSPGYVAAELAILAIGGVKVAISTMLSSQEIADIADRVEPQTVIVGDGCSDQVAGVPATRLMVTADQRPPQGRRDEVSLTWTRKRDLDSPRVISFSGGTTGVPKGIVHSERGMLANLWAQIIESGIDIDDRVLLSTPLVHAAGLFNMTALARGAEVRVTDGFDTAEWLELVEDDGITWAFLVPTMIRRLSDLALETGWDNRTIRTIQYGAAPISVESLERARRVFGHVFQQLYGQTECPNYVTVLSKHDHALADTDPALLKSAGRATAMSQVAVLDDDGALVEPGVIGEVVARSPYMMIGYWRDPEGFAGRFSGDWLLTGDVGYLDDKGYLFLVDRKNDMIVTGGLNVYSKEVETVLSRHPWVAEVAVVGSPDARWGEAVHAYVMPAADHLGDVSVDELMEHVASELAKYKRPKVIEIRAELPLTRYGKIDKKALRSELWRDVERSIG